MLQSFFPQSEGIDVQDRILSFVAKYIKNFSHLIWSKGHGPSHPPCWAHLISNQINLCVLLVKEISCTFAKMVGVHVIFTDGIPQVNISPSLKGQVTLLKLLDWHLVRMACTCMWRFRATQMSARFGALMGCLSMVQLRIPNTTLHRRLHSLCCLTMAGIAQFGWGQEIVSLDCLAYGVKNKYV